MKKLVQFVLAFLFMESVAHSAQVTLLANITESTGSYEDGTSLSDSERFSVMIAGYNRKHEVCQQLAPYGTRVNAGDTIHSSWSGPFPVAMTRVVQSFKIAFECHYDLDQSAKNLFVESALSNFLFNQHRNSNRSIAPNASSVQITFLAIDSVLDLAFVDHKDLLPIALQRYFYPNSVFGPEMIAFDQARIDYTLEGTKHVVTFGNRNILDGHLENGLTGLTYLKALKLDLQRLGRALRYYRVDGIENSSPTINYLVNILSVDHLFQQAKSSPEVEPWFLAEFRESLLLTLSLINEDNPDSISAELFAKLIAGLVSAE